MIEGVIVFVFFFFPSPYGGSILSAVFTKVRLRLQLICTSRGAAGPRTAAPKDCCGFLAIINNYHTWAFEFERRAAPCGYAVTTESCRCHVNQIHTKLRFRSVPRVLLTRLELGGVVDETNYRTLTSHVSGSVERAHRAISPQDFFFLPSLSPEKSLSVQPLSVRLPGRS